MIWHKIGKSWNRYGMFRSRIRGMGVSSGGCWWALNVLILRCLMTSSRCHSENLLLTDSAPLFLSRLTDYHSLYQSSYISPDSLTTKLRKSVFWISPEKHRVKLSLLSHWNFYRFTVKSKHIISDSQTKTCKHSSLGCEVYASLASLLMV